MARPVKKVMRWQLSHNGYFVEVACLFNRPSSNVVVRQEGRIESIDFKLGGTLALIFLVIHPGLMFIPCTGSVWRC